MLSLYNTLHTISLVPPLPYWFGLFVLFLIIIRGYYVLGAMGATADPRVSVPVHLGWKFVPSGRSLMFHVANLVFIGQLISDEGTIAATLALKVT
jgi:hypothetical protein